MSNLATVKITDIVQGDRFRKDLGDIQQLVESIKRHGLIQPIAVKRQNCEKFLLLAGGRRFAACKLAGLEFIPCRIYPDTISELEATSIELMENIDRKDMTYMEECELKRKIHELKEQTCKGGQWTQQDTAKLFNVSTGTISNDLKLAKAIKQFPEIGWEKCKNKLAAMRLLKSFEEALIASTSPTSSAKSYSESKNTNVVIPKDFLSQVSNLPVKVFNFIELQQPDNITQTVRILNHCYDLLVEDAWLILWFEFPYYQQFLTLFESTKFEPIPLPVIYTGCEKQFASNLTLGCGYKSFLYAKKGNASLTSQRVNHFHFTSEYNLAAEVLKTFASHGARVLFPNLKNVQSISAAITLGMVPMAYSSKEIFDEYNKTRS